MPRRRTAVAANGKPRIKAPADAERVPQKHGGALLRGGVKRNPGGTQKQEAFRDRMRALASNEVAIAFLEEILEDPDHPAFMAARRYVTEYGYGKPVQPVEHTGDGGGPIRFTLAIGAERGDSDG